MATYVPWWQRLLRSVLWAERVEACLWLCRLVVSTEGRKFQETPFWEAIFLFYFANYDDPNGLKPRSDSLYAVGSGATADDPKIEP